MSMSLKIIKSEKNEIEIEIFDDSKNFIHPLLYEILKSDDVEFAANIKEHPLKAGSRIIVRTKNGNPVDTLNKAVETLQKKLGELKEEVSNLGINANKE